MLSTYPLRKERLILLVLAFTVIPVMAIAVSYGSSPIRLGTVLRVLLDSITGSEMNPEDVDRTIISQLRLPRVLGAFLVGGGLAVIGVAMQALVRNPLAEPYILGISGGAAAGASLFFLGFIPPLIATWFSVPLAAFLGSLLSISVVYLIAQSDGTVSVSRLLLAGVAMAALMGAFTSFITYLSPDPNQLRVVLFWLLGSLSGYSWSAIPLAAIASLTGVVSLFILSRHLDTFLMGEEPASGLGVQVEAVKKFLIVLAAFVTGILVSNSGAIGFVGLIIPHVVRSWVGISHRYVVTVSYLLGGIFLIAADLVARTILTGQDIPVGIVTAMAGVPFFLILLRRSQYQFT